MAMIPLNLIGWEFDTDRRVVVARLAEAPAADALDPANHRPATVYVVEFKQVTIQKHQPIPDGRTPHGPEKPREPRMPSDQQREKDDRREW